MTPESCPCGSGRDFARCCGKWHDGRWAPTAEALMRSRYSAFVVHDAAYLERTWADQTRPDEVTFVPGQRWTGLTILDIVAGGMADQHGIVTFEATFERDGRPGVHTERSAFVREHGHWVYLGSV